MNGLTSRDLSIFHKYIKSRVIAHNWRWRRGRARSRLAVSAHLLHEIEADRETLRRIADSVGAGTSALKEIGAWAEEKISRLKLRDLDENGLGLFEALEFLELGIHGKRALWSALVAIAPADARLRGIDFSSLCERAEAQETEVGTLASETGPGCPEAVLTFATKARKD